MPRTRYKSVPFFGAFFYFCFSQRASWSNVWWRKKEFGDKLAKRVARSGHDLGICCICCVSLGRIAPVGRCWPRTLRHAQQRNSGGQHWDNCGPLAQGLCALREQRQCQNVCDSQETAVSCTRVPCCFTGEQAWEWLVYVILSYLSAWTCET